MPRHARTVIEYRSYDLPAHFPILLLTGERWYISDIPTGVLHFHNCMELGLCENGSGALEFEDSPCSFTAGDVTAISGDLPHTTYSTKGTASKWSYVFLDPAELLRPFVPLDALPHGDWYRDLLHDYGSVFSKADHPAIYLLMQGIINGLRDKPLNYEISVRALVLALLTQLMRLRSEQGPTVSSSMPIAPALEYINSHYMDNFSIEDLADVCHMSASHFRKLFSAIMGISPLEHLNRTRILRACSLLRMTEDSVLHISDQVGFRSLSSFNRHFSAMMGEAPTEWRRKANANKSVSILKYSGWLQPPPPSGGGK